MEGSPPPSFVGKVNYFRSGFFFLMFSHFFSGSSHVRLFSAPEVKPVKNVDQMVGIEIVGEVKRLRKQLLFDHFTEPRREGGEVGLNISNLKAT